MNEDLKTRLDKVRSRLEEEGIDALLVLIAENRRYLSGFTGEDTGYDESAGALVITPSDLILATDSRYTTQAQNESPGFRIYTYKKGLSRELPEIIEGLDIKRLGFEKRRMTCEQFDLIKKHLDESRLTIELVGTKDIVENLRIIKTKAEIDAIAMAVKVAEDAFSGLLEQIDTGMREIDAAWVIEKNMREAGAESTSFPVITAVGTNAALPHAIVGERLIEAGKPILFDWGARLKGYCSDTSRTIILGRADDKFKRIFDAVHDAQQKAIEAVKPGVFTKEIDAVARDFLKKQGLDTYFGHGLGHGVGLAIHEQPSLSPMAEKNIPLEEGMVFTVEPGVYLPDWGGVRLENMVVVRKNGSQVLNRLPMRIETV